MTLDTLLSHSCEPQQLSLYARMFALPQWAAERGYHAPPTFADWQREFKKPLNPHTMDWYPYDDPLNLSLGEWHEWFIEEECLEYEYDPSEPLTPEEEALCEALLAPRDWEDLASAQRKRSRCAVLEPTSYLQGLPLFSPAQSLALYSVRRE